MKIDPKPLEKSLKEIESILARLAAFPAEIAKYKREAEEFKRKVDLSNEGHLRIYRAATDKAEIASNLELRARERLEELDLASVEKMIEDLGNQLAEAGSREAVSLRDKVSELLRPWCPKVTDGDGQILDTAEMLAGRVNALNLIPQSRHSEILLGAGSLESARQDIGRLATALVEWGKKILSAHSRWEAAGGKFFTGFSR